MSGDAGTESARRVGDVLLALGEAGGPVGVNELGRRVGLSPTVAHRILQALASRGLVSQDLESQRYGLGSAAMLLGGQAIAQSNLREIARPVLERLVDVTEQTATISVLAGTRRIYVDQVLPRTEMKLSVEIGRPYSLLLGSSGRAILAALPDSVVDMIVRTPVPAEHGPAAPHDSSEILERLAEVRRKGVAISRGERIQGAGGVSAALRNLQGEVMGAVNVLGPLHYFTDESIDRYVLELLDAARDIESLMKTTLSVS